MSLIAAAYGVLACMAAMPEVILCARSVWSRVTYICVIVLEPFFELDYIFACNYHLLLSFVIFDVYCVTSFEVFQPGIVVLSRVIEPWIVVGLSPVLTAHVSVRIGPFRHLRDRSNT